MKAIHGLILAIGLGIGAAILNFAYLNTKTKGTVTVEFVGVAEDTIISRGERLTQEDLVAVPIPKVSVGNLGDFAVLYKARDSVLGDRVWRTLEGGNLLLRDDTKTPPQALNPGEGYGAIGVPFDSKSFPPSLIMPGDKVSFVFPRAMINTPRRAVANPLNPVNPGEEPIEKPEPQGPTETIGPFTVLSMGNRLGTSEVMRANRVPQIMENVMTIRVKWKKDGSEMDDPKAQKLLDRIYTSGARQVGIQLHPRKKKQN